jgi:hypothetical protein
MSGPHSLRALSESLMGPLREASNRDPEVEARRATDSERGLRARRWTRSGQQALLVDSVGGGLLVALGTLDPEERVAFVLHDMFAAPFAEIASIVGRDDRRRRRQRRCARGQLHLVLTFVIEGDRIAGYELIAAPDRLAARDLAVLDEVVAVSDTG